MRDWRKERTEIIANAIVNGLSFFFDIETAEEKKEVIAIAKPIAEKVVSVYGGLVYKTNRRVKFELAKVLSETYGDDSWKKKFFEIF